MQPGLLLGKFREIRHSIQIADCNEATLVPCVHTILEAYEIWPETQTMSVAYYSCYRVSSQQCLGSSDQGDFWT